MPTYRFGSASRPSSSLELWGPGFGWIGGGRVAAAYLANSGSWSATGIGRAGLLRYATPPAQQTLQAGVDLLEQLSDLGVRRRGERLRRRPG